MTLPLVSIITVVFNAEETIADTLRSVSLQRYTNIEHIVIDGASTDKTLSVIKRYPHVAKVISEPDEGIYDAMNKGLSLASGEVVALLNADDHYQHDRVIDTAVAALYEQDVDACYADLVYVKYDHPAEVVRYWTSRSYEKGLCFSGWMPAHPTLFLRAHVYQQAGLFDTSLRYQADLEFCARIFEKLAITSAYVPEIWVRMRMGGVTNRSLKTVLAGNWESYQALKKLGLTTNPILFFARKWFPRLLQYLRRPKKER